MVSALFWAVVRPPLPRWWRLLWAVGLFWAFLWLGPQVYYLYYLAIFEGLPVQAVVGWPPPDIGEFGTTILFLTQPHLPDLARGSLFWLLILAALTRRETR